MTPQPPPLILGIKYIDFWNKVEHLSITFQDLRALGMFSVSSYSSLSRPILGIKTWHEILLV